MQVELNSIVKGINEFEGGQTALATKAGVARQKVNAVVTGREGISLNVARAITKSLPEGGDPVALYVASQCAAMKREAPAPEEVLRRVSVVAKHLRAVGDLGESEALKAALSELTRVNNEALASTTQVMESLGRDGSGVKKQKPNSPDGPEAERERVATKAKTHGDALGRGAGGRKIAKRHDLV